jgi:abnormal spindle-like microcephaly-associated protein
VQLYNTGLALQALQEAAVPLDALPTSRGLVVLKPEDLVDGDRERTLAVLWAIARTLQLPHLLKLTTLKAELQRVLASLRRHQSKAGPEAAAKMRRQQQRAAPLAVYLNDEMVSLLMQWVQAVCSHFDTVVQNFTTCFADGRVLCLLVG